MKPMLTQNLHTVIHISHLVTTRTEQPRCPSRVSKQTAVHPDHEILLGYKKDKPIDTLKSLGWIASVFLLSEKKPKVSKSHILWRYITFSTWQNYRVGEQINSCQELEMVGGKGWSDQKRVVGGRLLKGWNGSETWLQCGYTNLYIQYNCTELYAYIAPMSVTWLDIL